MTDPHKFSHSQPIADDPPHYTRLSPEPWKMAYAWFGPAGCLSHVLKYIARAGHKDGSSLLCDLKKARNWLDFAIAKLEG